MHEAWSQLEHDAFAVEEPTVDLLGGLAGMLATALPLAIGVALDEPALGLATALGGINAALGTPARGPARARWGAAAVGGTTASVLLGTALNGSVPVLVVLTMVVTAATAELRRFGRDGAMCGFVIAAMVVIAGGLPAAGALERTAAYLLGGLAGLALVLAAGPPSAPATPADNEADDEADAQATEPAAPEPGAAPSPIDAARLHAHAARTSVAVGAALAGARAAELAFGYWVPLTTLAVLQPEPHASWVRMVQRSVGTFVGVVAVLVVTWATTDAVVLVPLVACCSFALFALRERSYYWVVLTLTPTVLLMISTDVPLGPAIAGDRLVATVAGLAVAAAANGATVAWLRLSASTRPGR